MEGATRWGGGGRVDHLSWAPVLAGLLLMKWGFGRYNELNGTPMCANHDLLQGVLRDEFNFSGHVVGCFTTRPNSLVCVAAYLAHRTSCCGLATR